MSFKHIKQADLNSLYHLKVLLEEKHISKAADRCFLSQPAMSRMLDRLRRDFGDELLIRNGRNYELSAKAIRIRQQLESLLPQIEAMISGSGEDPLLMLEQVRLIMNDHSSAVILPQIMRHLRFDAPHLKILVEGFTDHRFDDIRSGRADLLFAAAAAPMDLMNETLYTEEFVCVVSPDHPVLDRTLDIDLYMQFPHIVVSTLEGQQTIIEQRLGELALQRRVRVSLPYFLPAMYMLQGSDMILTSPKRVAYAVAPATDVRIISAPPLLQPMSYRMIWHKRSNNDPVQQWLREKIRKAMGFLHNWNSGDE